MSVDQWNATEGMMKSGSESSRASETGMTYKQVLQSPPGMTRLVENLQVLRHRMCESCSNLLHAELFDSGAIQLGSARQDAAQRLVPKQPVLSLGGQHRSTFLQKRNFQSRRPTPNPLAMFGKMPNFPEKPRMVKVPIPPADQWLSAVQKSKSEKKAAEGTPVGAQSPKLTRTQKRRMLRKRASAKPNLRLAVKYPAENKAGKGDHKRLEKGKEKPHQQRFQMSYLKTLPQRMT